MTDLLNNLLNIGCVAIILLFAVIAIKVELDSVKSYEKDFKLIEAVINALKNSNIKENQDWILPSGNEEILTWLFKHLDIKKNKQGSFIAQRKHNRFVLLAYPNILSKPVPRSPVYYAPTLLTALGILGTFLGIFLGLQGINLENISETQSLLDASTKLLSGMKLAFVTSLFGLGSASLLMFLLALYGKKREEYRNERRKDLSKIAFVETSERLLSRLDTTSNDDAVEQLKELKTSLSNLSQLNPNAIAQAIEQAIASPESPLVQEFKRIRELQETQGQTVESLVRQLRTELIEPVVERLEQSAQLTQEASQAVRELKNELGGISQGLAGAVQTIQSFQQDTLVQLQKFATNLQAILSNFQGETKGVLEQVGKEINQAVAQSISGMEAQRIAFEKSAEQASITFRGIREDLQAALNHQAQEQKQMLQEVHRSTKDILISANEAFENQSNTLIAVGKEASSLMNQGKDNLLGTLSNIDEMLQNTRQTVQQELERFRLDYQAALQEFFTEQNNLLNNTLGQQREGLAQVVNNLQDAFNQEAQKRLEMTEQVNQSLNKIKETVQTVNTLASAIGMNSSERLAQLQELARTIGDEAHQVERAYQNMTDQFNEALIEGNKQLFGYLQKANEVYTKNLEDTDKSAAQVCNKLNETSHGFMNVAQYLVAAANELKNGNGRH